MDSILKTLSRLATGILALAFAATLPAAADEILIENVTLIDGTGAAQLPGASVLVSGDRIVAVSPSDIRKPRGAKVLNGKGKFLIPGLIDTHIHTRGGLERGVFHNDRGQAMQSLHTYLYSGVTSVGDHGNHPDFIFPLRDDERAGRIVSPRIFAVGNAITFPRGGAEAGGGVSIASLQDVHTRIDAMLKYKPDLIKIVWDGNDSIRGDLVPLWPEIFREIVHYTNRHGVAVTTHIGSSEEFLQVLDGGTDDLAHAPISDRLSPEAIASAAVRKVPISTTAIVFANIARVADDISWLETQLFKDTLDAATLEFQKVAERERYIKSGMSARFKPNVENIVWNMGELHKAGALLALGSDRAFGPMSLQELELYAQAGIPLLDILTIATRNAAIYFGKEDELGTVSRGKLADLVLLKADPTKDVKNYASVDTVIKGGKIIDLAALDLPVNKKK